jgi:hypothetical protein
MSGNWNGEILDMDEGKKRSIELFDCTLTKASGFSTNEHS